MLADISARQLMEWAELEELDPSGERRADLRLAYGLATLAAAITGRKQRVGDYVLDLAPKQQTWQEMRAQFMMAAKMTDAHNRKN